MIPDFKTFINERLWTTAVNRGIEGRVKKEDNKTPIINEFMERHEIKNYTINKDMTVDVDGNVKVDKEDLIDGKLPFTFGKVTGYFWCRDINLTSLEGAPKEVGGIFSCFNNQLTSLEGAPEKVGGSFYCSNNKLTSLKGAPKEVGGDFKCQYNKLASLAGAPEKVGGDFDCEYNKLTSLNGAPKEVGGYFDCSDNTVKFTKDDIPSIVKGKIHC